MTLCRGDEELAGDVTRAPGRGGGEAAPSRLEVNPENFLYLYGLKECFGSSDYLERLAWRAGEGPSYVFLDMGLPTCYGDGDEKDGYPHVRLAGLELNLLFGGADVLTIAGGACGGAARGFVVGHLSKRAPCMLRYQSDFGPTRDPAAVPKVCVPWPPRLTYSSAPLPIFCCICTSDASLRREYPQVPPFVGLAANTSSLCTLGELCQSLKT